MHATSRKGPNIGNGRLADLSDAPSSVLPHLPSLSLQLSGEGDSLFEPGTLPMTALAFPEPPSTAVANTDPMSSHRTPRGPAASEGGKRNTRTADDALRRRLRTMAMGGGGIRAHTSETQISERSLLSSYSDRKLKTSMSYGEGKSFYRRASKLSPQKLKRFSQISQENLWDPRYLLGCKIPVGVQFDTWPVKPKGNKNKPALLRKLEAFVQTEMGFLDLSSKDGYNFAKFEVFQRLFEVFIMEFRTYGHLLKTIKDEYESYIDYLQKQVSNQEDLKAQLEIFERNAERQRKSIHAKAFTDISQARTKIDQLVCENQDLRAKLNQQQKYMDVKNRKIEVLEFWMNEKENALVTAEKEIMSAKTVNFASDEASQTVERLKIERDRAFERIEQMQAKLSQCIPRESYDNCLEEIKRLRAEAGVSLVARRMDAATFTTLSKLAEKIMEDEHDPDKPEDSVVEKILSVANSKVLKVLEFEDLCGLLQGDLQVDDISQELETKGVSERIKKYVKSDLALQRLATCIEQIGVSSTARLVGDRNTISLVKLVLSGALAALPNSVDARSLPSTPANFNELLKNRFKLGKMGALEGLLDTSQIAILKYRLQHSQSPSPDIMGQVIASEKPVSQKLTCKDLFISLLSHSDVCNTFTKCTGSSLDELEKMSVATVNDFANIMSTILHSDVLSGKDKKKPTMSTKSVGQYSRDSYFVGLGTGASVPKYLRTNNKIRNRKLIKATAEGMVKEAWREKMKWGQEMEMEEFFFAFLQKKFGLQAMIAEWGYNLINALKKYSYDADCELFLKVLQGEIGEEVYRDQMHMIEKYKEELRAADFAVGGKVIGRLPKLDFMKITKQHFSNKSEEQLETLWECLEQDQQGDWVMYELLFEEDRSGDQGQFAEEIRDQFLAEREQYLQVLEEALIEAMGTTSESPYDDMLTLEQARIGILTADIDCDYATLNMYLRYGFDIPDEVNIDEALVDPVTLGTYMKRIKSCNVQKSKRAALRTPNKNANAKRGLRAMANAASTFGRSRSTRSR